MLIYNLLLFLNKQEYLTRLQSMCQPELRSSQSLTERRPLFKPTHIDVGRMESLVGVGQRYSLVLSHMGLSWGSSHMAVGFHQNRQTGDRETTDWKIKVRVFLYPNLRSDIPSVLPCYVGWKQVTSPGHT